MSSDKLISGIQRFTRRHWPTDRSASEDIVRSDLDRFFPGEDLPEIERWRLYSCIKNNYCPYIPIGLRDYAARMLADRLNL